MNNTCIPHSGAIASNGYGASWFEGRYCGAHVKAYCLHHKKPRAALVGQVVRHKCDNRACVNPAHLELGTSADNSQDMVDRNRQGTKPALEMADAKNIRAVYKPGRSDTNQPKLAKLYGVKQSVISQILRNITYKEQHNDH